MEANVPGSVAVGSELLKGVLPERAPLPLSSPSR
jgi:hypothetical protein